MRRSAPQRACAIICVAAATFIGCGGPQETGNGATYVVKRGNLTVAITEGGSLEAVKSVNITSEVEGNCRILEIVPEGSFVKEGQTLVKLDGVDLRDRITQQEITVQNTKANFAQAESNYKIQLNQNESNIKTAQLKVRFAKLDLEKYLGENLATTVTEDSDLLALVRSDELGGEGLQTRLKLQSDIDLSKEERTRAGTKLKSTTRLAEQKYVTQTELEADRLAFKRSEIALEKAEVAQSLFYRYEFLRQVAQLQSDHHEAQRQIERVKAKAESEMANAEAKLNAQKQTLQLQTSKLEKLRDQHEKTEIKAPQDGMVVYASSMGRRGRSSGTLIEAGASIRYQQTIISLPDTSAMKVEVSIHEASIEKIKVGQNALITVDAFPERTVTGKVTKVAVLPDSPMRWLNPDIKVYRTEVAMHERWEGLKPGMSAKVEIIVARPKNVLSVPVQAVVMRKGESFCYVDRGGPPVKTTIQIGNSTDRFVEIQSGLKAGDRVLLAPPDEPEKEKDAEDDAASETGADAPPDTIPPASPQPPGAQPRPITRPAGRPGDGRGERRGEGRGDRTPRDRTGDRTGGHPSGGMPDPAQMKDALKSMTPEQIDQIRKSIPAEQRAQFEKALKEAKGQ